MSIELDWQIVNQDVPPPDQAPQTSPPRRSFNWRLWLLVFGSILIVLAAFAAAYVAITYRTQLDRAEQAIRPIARLEAQSIAADDLGSFLALQDPDDKAWRALQEKRFGKLERDGLPEFGWKALGTPPQVNSVTLEPGGAQLNVTYHFSVTQPLPGGPVSITLRVPQYFKPTPSGWVRAWPTAEYWGRWHQRPGRRVSVIYTYRDAPVIEPLIQRIDDMAARLCETLPCPDYMGLLFDNQPAVFTRLSDFSYGFDDNITVRLPSPHLMGIPIDAPSRDEYLRAVETRVVQALVVESSNRQLNLNYYAAQELVRWELAQAGLTGPFIHDAITRTLRASPALARQPISNISLRARSLRLESAPGQIVVPLAFDFLDKELGSGTVARMTPFISSSRVSTLGEAIASALRVNPTSLEPAWQKYLREREGLAGASLKPDGELALWCANNPTDRAGSTIFWTRADGSAIQFPGSGPGAPNMWSPHWSPDGKQLAYAQGNATSARVMVMNVESRMIRIVADDLRGAPTVDWLPDGRLQLAQNTTRLINLETDQEIEVEGVQHAWSPDGTRMAYLEIGPTTIIWVADANGQGPRYGSPGRQFAWSPDGKRLAILGYSGVARSPSVSTLQIIDVTNSRVRTLARASDLMRSLTGNSSADSTLTHLAWSQDGTLLAVAVDWSGGSAVVVLDTSSGAARARWQWEWTLASFPALAWSNDNRHLAVRVMPDSILEGSLGVLDILTLEQKSLPGRNLAWSPDGKWLAVTQDPSGLLISTPDLSVMHWLDTPNCFDVTWRPKR